MLFLLVIFCPVKIGIGVLTGCFWVIFGGRKSVKRFFGRTVIILFWIRNHFFCYSTTATIILREHSNLPLLLVFININSLRLNMDRKQFSKIPPKASEVSLESSLLPSSIFVVDLLLFLWGPGPFSFILLAPPEMVSGIGTERMRGRHGCMIKLYVLWLLSLLLTFFLFFFF